jgi:hypothetical protein
MSVALGVSLYRRDVRALRSLGSASQFVVGLRYDYLRNRYWRRPMRNTACMALVILLTSSAYGQAPANDPYPTMAPVSQYLMPRDAEIEMARSAGPASISANAEVLVLTNSGYAVAVKGSNGWVCFVGRMWMAGLDDPEFWNPKGRGPGCLNPPAVQSV